MYRNHNNLMLNQYLCNLYGNDNTEKIAIAEKTITVH